MGSAILIRRTTTDDVDVYREIRLRALEDAPEAFASTYADESQRPVSAFRERVERASEGDDAAAFLAFDGDRCIGLVGTIPDDLGADRQLVSMWVDPAYRGTEAASGLVNAVLEWARQAGARTIGLWVTRGNDRAQRFYERMGFAVTGDVQPLPSDPCKDEVRMLREL